MKTSIPKISIITPSYNQGIYLKETIQSVLSQQYPELEYIVIDGGSLDNSIEVIKKYSSQLAYWVSEKDKGQSEAINKGLRKATGDIIAWLNSDDWYTEKTLAIVANQWIQKPFDVLHGDAVFYYGNNSHRNYTTHYGSNCDLNRLMKYWNTQQHCNPPQPSVFISKKVLDAVGLINEDFEVAMDYDLWLRIAQKGFSFRYIPEVLSYYRFHEDSKSGLSGNFDHFRKEWHKVFKSNVVQLSLSLRVKYLTEYFKYSMSKKLQVIKRNVSLRLKNLIAISPFD